MFFVRAAVGLFLLGSIIPAEIREVAAEDKPAVPRKVVGTCVINRLVGYQTVATDCRTELPTPGNALIRGKQIFKHNFMTHEWTNADKRAVRNSLSAVQKALGAKFRARNKFVFTQDDFCFFDSGASGKELVRILQGSDTFECQNGVIFDPVNRQTRARFSRIKVDGYDGMFPSVTVTPVFVGGHLGGDRFHFNRRLYLLLTSRWHFCEGDC